MAPTGTHAPKRDIYYDVSAYAIAFAINKAKDQDSNRNFKHSGRILYMYWSRWDDMSLTEGVSVICCQIC